MKERLPRKAFKTKQDIYRNLPLWRAKYKQKHGRLPTVEEMLEAMRELPHQDTGKKTIYKK